MSPGSSSRRTDSKLDTNANDVGEEGNAQEEKKFNEDESTNLALTFGVAIVAGFVTNSSFGVLSR